MPYFNYFPLMAYDVKGTKQYKLLPHILKRVKLRAGIKNGVFLFDNYDVKYGEKPEDVAFKYYDDSELHWVILMTNDITDRYYEWPMTEPQFQNFIEDKYGLANRDSIHHYDNTQASRPTPGKGAAEYSYIVECNSDEDGATSVSNREYEERIQDKNRQIRLLDKKYLSQFVEEFQRLVQE